MVLDMNLYIFRVFISCMQLKCALSTLLVICSISSSRKESRKSAGCQGKSKCVLENSQQQVDDIYNFFVSASNFYYYLGFYVFFVMDSLVNNIFSGSLSRVRQGCETIACTSIRLYIN